jgi:hypothetical protein
MPNYDLGLSLPCWPVGSEEWTEKHDDLIVYPNPARTTLTLSSEALQGKRVLVRMYSMHGQEVLSKGISFFAFA